MTQKEYYDFREDENTRQVSLYKLLRCAAKRWKLILLAGIILGGLMGSYKILSIHSKKQDMIEDYDTYKTKLDAYKTSVKDYKKSIANYQEAIADKLEYIENSPLMKLNVFACPTSTADINITAANETVLKSDSVIAIKNTISDDIFYGSLLDDVAKKHNLSVKDLRELTTVKLSSSSGTSFRISCRAETEEEAEKIRDEVLAAMSTYQKSLSASFGNFSFDVVSKGTMTIVDTEIQTLQEAQRTALTKLQTSSYTAQNQNANLVKPVSVPQYSKKYMLINGIKMGVVGMAAGMILAAIAVMVLVIMKGYILSTDEIDGEYGLRTLADLSGGRSGKSSGEIGYVIARIENCMSGEKGNKIGVVGSVQQKDLDSIANALNEKSRESGSDVQFTAISGITKDAEALRKLKSIDCVVLTEEIGKSEYNGIRKEIALIADSGRDLLGTIYL